MSKRHPYPPAAGHEPGVGHALCLMCHRGWPCPTARKHGINKKVVHRVIADEIRQDKKKGR